MPIWLFILSPLATLAVYLLLRDDGHLWRGALGASLLVGGCVLWLLALPDCVKQ